MTKEKRKFLLALAVRQLIFLAIATLVVALNRTGTNGEMDWSLVVITAVGANALWSFVA
jgi:hypothetical protein